MSDVSRQGFPGSAALAATVEGAVGGVAAAAAPVVKGRVRTTAIAPDGKPETNDFDPGDVWYFPRGHGHLLQGLGPEEAHFILVFDDGAFSEFGTYSSTDWLGLTPPEVLSKSLGLPASAFAQFPKKDLSIVQSRIPPPNIPASHQGGQKLSHRTHRYPLLAQQPHSKFAVEGLSRPGSRIRPRLSRAGCGSREKDPIHG